MEAGGERTNVASRFGKSAGHGIPPRPSSRRSISRRYGRRWRSKLVAEADARNVHLEIIETMSGREIISVHD
jgi:hypothetical protein